MYIEKFDGGWLGYEGWPWPVNFATWRASWAEGAEFNIT